METTRERMIVAMAHLVRANGYSGAGLNQIITDARAPKGSMYHHFPAGKEELGEAAIAYYGDVVRSLLERCLGEGSVVDGIGRFVDALANQLERSEFYDGCPVGLMAMEVGPANDRLAAATQAALDLWIASVETHLRAAGVPDATDRATAIIAAVEGGVILARCHRSAAPLRAVSRGIALLAV
jgi:TetR/AcrR family transcriptional repressor of lmrAB and yxaGH operons